MQWLPMNSSALCLPMFLWILILTLIQIF